MPGQRLDLEKLLRVPNVDMYGGFDLSPDERWLAFAWNLSGRWEIYLLDLVSMGEPRQLTGGEGAKFGPRFAPDGSAVLYALDTNGSEAFDICVCDLATGYQINLTPDSAESIQPKLRWSPDGKRIAFISNRSGRFSTYILEVEPSEGWRTAKTPRLVFDGSGPNMTVEWSPDGALLAVGSESHGQDMAVHLVPAAQGAAGDGERRALQLSDHGEALNARQACWSPDGKRLAFACDRSGSYEIGIYELASDRITWLGSGAGDDSEPDWSPDGRRLAFVHSEGPQSWLAIQALDQQSKELHQVEPGMHYSPRFSRDGSRVYFVFESPRRPGDLWRLDLESKTCQALTRSLPIGLAPDDFVMPEHIHYPSLDGRSVPALIYLPSREGGLTEAKPPAAVVIHGGPSWLFQFLWYPIMAHMASRGWVVLAPNYRGSTGYGREWQLANRFELGKGDTMDVAAGADYLMQEGLADPDRIAVTGRSHGGFLTMSCLTRYPERWRAGSAVVPFLNWFTAHENSRQDLQHWDIENMGDPIECADLWRERSPYFYLEQVRAPVQLICGANDPRCPASESVMAYEALRALGKEVDFRLYPDEGHTFLKVENVVEHELRRVEFLAKALEIR